MSILLTIGVAVICAMLIVSTRLIVLPGLLARTSSPPFIQLSDTHDNHQHTATEALSYGR
jgi:hypothetical protein